MDIAANVNHDSVAVNKRRSLKAQPVDGLEPPGGGGGGELPGDGGDIPGGGYNGDDIPGGEVSCAISDYFPTKENICQAYTQVLTSFTALMPVAGTSINGDFTRSKILGKALRLAFHDAGEIDIRTEDLLGPDGCLSNTGKNAGLLAGTIVDTLFEPIYQENKDLISRADFWALLGWLAVSLGSNGAASIYYQYGRKDATCCPVPSSRLPGGQTGHEQLKEYFLKQLGLTLEDAVTLMGAHTLGHTDLKFSGYAFATTPVTAYTIQDLQRNAWDTTPQTFDNEYYRSMVEVVSKIDETRAFSLLYFNFRCFIKLCMLYVRLGME